MTKLPKWLDRERRIHALEIVNKVKADAAEMWFRRYQTLLKDLSIARTTVDNRDTEIVALKRQVASTQLRLAEARQERERLNDQIAKYEQGAIPS